MQISEPEFAGSVAKTSTMMTGLGPSPPTPATDTTLTADMDRSGTRRSRFRRRAIRTPVRWGWRRPHAEQEGFARITKLRQIADVAEAAAILLGVEDVDGQLLLLVGQRHCGFLVVAELFPDEELQIGAARLRERRPQARALAAARAMLASRSAARRAISAASREEGAVRAAIHGLLERDDQRYRHRCGGCTGSA